MIIPIAVNDKIASLCGGRRCIVCDNSDYIASFEFDSTWEKYEIKTARFVYGGGHTDVVFSGSRCAVPVISNPGTVTIGVFSGNLSTSTGVKLTAIRSIRSSGGAPIPPTSAIYDQIMDKINELGNIDPEKIAKAVSDYLAEHPLTAEDVGAVSEDELSDAINTALTRAKESGEFDGVPGEDGAPGANGITPTIGDNGNWYLGDEDTGRPSRGAKGDPGKDGAGLNVTGATVGQIVKISAVDDNGVPTAWEAVDMPSGGGGETWEKIAEVELTADVQIYELASFNTYRKIKVMVSRPAYISGLNKNVWFEVAYAGSIGNQRFYSCGYMASGYGYRAFDVTVEINNMFITSRRTASNNPDATVTCEATADQLLGDASTENLVMRMRFTDTSVIQQGDTVTVIGVRK